MCTSKPKMVEITTQKIDWYSAERVDILWADRLNSPRSRTRNKMMVTEKTAKRAVSRSLLKKVNRPMSRMGCNGASSSVVVPNQRIQKESKYRLPNSQNYKYYSNL